MHIVVSVLTLLGMGLAGIARGDGMAAEVASLAGVWEGRDESGATAVLTLTPAADGPTVASLTLELARGLLPTARYTWVAGEGRAFLVPELPGADGVPAASAFVLDKRSASLLRFTRLTRLPSEEQVIQRAESLSFGAPRMDGRRKLTLGVGTRLCHEGGRPELLPCGSAEAQVFMMTRR